MSERTSGQPAEAASRTASPNGSYRAAETKTGRADSQRPSSCLVERAEAMDVVEHHLAAVRAGERPGRADRHADPAGGGVEQAEILALVPQAPGGEDEIVRRARSARPAGSGRNGRCAAPRIEAVEPLARRRRKPAVGVDDDVRRRRSPARTSSVRQARSAGSSPPCTASHQVATQLWWTATTGRPKSASAASAGALSWTMSASLRRRGRRWPPRPGASDGFVLRRAGRGQGRYRRGAGRGSRRAPGSARRSRAAARQGEHQFVAEAGKAAREVEAVAPGGGGGVGGRSGHEGRRPPGRRARRRPIGE